MREQPGTGEQLRVRASYGRRLAVGAWSERAGVSRRVAGRAQMSFGLFCFVLLRFLFILLLFFD
jgi:hypothetical protein